jgi:hypothetical protein
MPANSRLVELRRTRDTGCLRDLATEPFKPRLPFERGRQTAPDWWNGLFYSRYQLLALPMLKDVLAERTYQKHGKQRMARLPMTDAALVERMDKQRRTAAALTALEARYLPNLDPEWIHLSGVPDTAEWEAYRARFDPVQMQRRLQYPTEQLYQDAEWLLIYAHNTDPVGLDWGRLMRRAPAKSWKDLKDAALIAMDDRVAAEILLRFYEDLALRGQAEPLPDLLNARTWHPLAERISYRPGTLDEDLVRLGLSPHPRVVLALEGESEMYHVPRVWQALGFSDAPELMRLLKLGTVSRDLTKVAALTAAPLVSQKVLENEWSLIKPYTRLFIAVDPDEPLNTKERVERERTKILDEIKDVLKAQGVEHPNPQELDQLVEIRTWKAPCYEFAQFDDGELAEGIMKMHKTINGLTKDQLVASLRHSRDRGMDIKEVWSRWEYKVSKVKLAEALWPTLLHKIQMLKTTEGAPVPPIVEVVSDAYQLAQQWRYLSYLITEVPEQAAQTDTASTNP